MRSNAWQWHRSARSSATSDADDYRRLFPDGRIGSDPTLSRPEHGARLVDAAVHDLKDDYQRFLTQA